MLLKMIILFTVFCLLIFFYVKYLEKTVVFFPAQEVKFSPADINADFDDVYFITADGIKLNAWFIPAEGADYTILLFHGNAGNIGDRLERISLLRQLNQNIFIVDYRGYGRSEGIPSEKNVYVDAEAAFNYLVNERKIAPEAVIIYGVSLGGAVAVDLASKKMSGALVLESTFSSGRDMAKRMYPFLPAFFFSNMFDSTAKIKSAKMPKLFIHSPVDEIVPFELAKKIYDISPGPKRFAEISGDHNAGFLDSPEIGKTILEDFISGLRVK